MKRFTRWSMGPILGLLMALGGLGESQAVANETTRAAAPLTMTQSVTHDGETITMRLTREDLRGDHFELWVQNSSGGYDVATATDERSYIGTVDEYPDAVSCGVVIDDGTFKGTVYFDRGMTWFTLGADVINTRGGPPSTYKAPSHNVDDGQAGTTMYGFDVGIDVSYDYYIEAGNGDVAETLDIIEYSVNNVRAIYMRDALLQPFLGRVIIRGDQAQDPYLDSMTLTGVRSHWNDNHDDAERDVVCGVDPDFNGGLAYVGVMGTGSAYSANNGGGSDGEFSVIWRHELGHNWGSGHFEGGTPEGKTIMSGNGLGRFSGPELGKVLNHRDGRLGILDDLGTYNTVNLPPYAAVDLARDEIYSGESANIDVLANDHDANGEALTIDQVDAQSSNGATLAISSGTGPDGRDEIIYTAPEEYFGTDVFFYHVVDESGQGARGLATINVQKTPKFVLETDADTYVNDDTNHGDESNIVIKRGSTGPGSFYTRTGWVHFDLSEGLPESGGPQLRMISDGGGASGTVTAWGIVDGQPGDTYGSDWTENGIVKSNAPQQPDFNEGAQTTELGSVDTTFTGSSMLITTSALEEFLAADTNGEVTILLVREVDDADIFAIRSRENLAGGGATLEFVSVGDADAFVRGGASSGDNYGFENQLYLKEDNNDGYDREAFLRFDYSDRDLIEPIVNVSLELTPIAVGSGADDMTIQVQLLDDEEDRWGEGSLTWDNRPAGNGQTVEFSGPFEVGVAKSVDVTALIQQAFNQNKLAGFRLVVTSSPGSEKLVQFASREHSEIDLRPRLVIDDSSHAPEFAADPIVKPDGLSDEPYSGETLADEASDQDAGDVLTFSKLDGPAWLSISEDGALSGTPAPADTGMNSFTVRVSDQRGKSDEATLRIEVIEAEPNSVGAEWLDYSAWSTN